MATPHLIVAIVGLLAILISGAVLSRRIKVSVISPATVALAAFALPFIMRPAVLAFMPGFAHDFVRYISRQTVLVALAYFVGGLALWTFAVMVMVWHQRRDFPPDLPHDGTVADLMGHGLRIVGLMMWAALFAKYVVAAGKLASIQDYVARADAPGLIVKPVAALVVISSSLVVYRLARRRARSAVFWLVQIAASLAGFGFGGRTTALGIVVAPFLTYLCARRGEIRWTRLLWVAVGVLPVAGVAWYYRANKAAATLGEGSTLVLASLSNTLGCSYDYYLGIVDTCSRESTSLRLGQTYAWGAIRLTRGFRRLATSTEAPGVGVHTLVGEQPDEGGVPATGMGEGFWNFGLLGLLLVAMAHGLLVGWAERVIRDPDLPIRPLWIVYLAYVTEPFTTRWFEQAIGTAVPLVLFLVVVSWRVQVRSRRPMPSYPAGAALSAAQTEVP